MDKINERIQKIRRDAKYKQSEVAELLNMKTNTYSIRERRGKFTGEDLLKLAAIFQVDVRKFLYDDIDLIKPTVIVPDECYMLNDREGHVITMYRNLSKEKQKEIFAFVYNTFKTSRHYNT